MSTSHRRFEALEPRVLLSGTRFVDGHLPTARPSPSPMVVQPEEIPAARQEDWAEEFPPLQDSVSTGSPPVTDRSATQEPATDLHDNPPTRTAAPTSIPSQQQPSDSAVVNVELPVDEPSRSVVPPEVSQPLIEKPTGSTKEPETAALVDASEDLDTMPTTEDRIAAGTTSVERAEAPRLDSNQRDVASDVVESYGKPSDDDGVSTTGDVAVRGPVAEASSDIAPASDTKPATDTTTASGDVDSRRSLTVAAAETAPAVPEVAPSRVELDASDDGRSVNQQPRRSRTEADATEETSSVRRSATDDQNNGVLSPTGEIAEQGAPSGEGLAETDSCAADEEPGGAVMLETAREPATTIETTSPDPASNDPAASPCEPTVMEANQPAASGAPISTATGSPGAARYDSNQDEPEDCSGKLVECVFAEEGSEPGDNQRAASQTLPVTEGALLLVALGKPLTRLAGGVEPVDATCADGGSPGTRSRCHRSRRDRRSTAEARSHSQRRKDARDVTWLPLDQSPDSLPQATTPSAHEQTGRSQPSRRRVSPRLADRAVFSHLGVSLSDNGSNSCESRFPILPSPAAWYDYEVVGAAAVATLAGSVSVLAVDRNRRLRAPRPPVGLPKPAYTGPTLSRVV